MKPVAARDEVAGELLTRACIGEADRGRHPVEIVDAHAGSLEDDLAAGGEPCRDQVLYHFVLGVDRDRLAAGQLGEIDAMAAAGKPQLDAVVHRAFALHALADADRLEEIDSALLEHARADGGFDVRAAPILEHHRLDAFGVKQVRKEKSGGARADDAYLSAHRLSSFEAPLSYRRSCTAW